MFQPEKINRDPDGFWLHSILQKSGYEELAIEQVPEAIGSEFVYVTFDEDAPQELQQRFDVAGLLRPGSEMWGDVISDWQPTKPEGYCWVLIAIFDTQDGPYACFARPKSEHDHHPKMVDFNESTGVGKWECPCGIVRTRQAAMVCKR